MLVVLAGNKISTLPTFIPSKQENGYFVLSRDLNFKYLDKEAIESSESIVLVDIHHLEHDPEDILDICIARFPKGHVWCYSADASHTMKDKYLEMGFHKVFNSDDNPAAHIQSILQSKK
ncbi:hypothetical protein E1176_11080 [Fulvivirga sp. RKSG066]|uniref:hypothetical protein n=1 Tax=Fulvivirga aurantia TaxID=2529383 RepID=UPI0012BC38DB|nr:hypothetical protein [Fulvivirga aurantia]MTI21562.1 hypothetical protein [Fulvivirga aurantia]